MGKGKEGEGDKVRCDAWQATKCRGGTQRGAWGWQWDLLPGLYHGASVLIRHSVTCWVC